MLSELHDSAPFSDLLLCCDGGNVDAHKAVLSLCSPYLGEHHDTRKDISVIIGSDTLLNYSLL